MWCIIGHARARLRHGLSLGSGMALLALAACELPQAPEWDIGVIAPLSSDPIGIVDFLPGIVQVDEGVEPPVFTIQRQADSQVFSYGELCGSLCALLIGQPIPGFAYADSFEVHFSDAELVSVEGLSGTLTLGFDNGLGFEPLRSNADTTGYIALAIRDMGSGATVDSMFLSADSEALGAAADTVFALSDVQLTDGVRIVFWVVSPFDGQTIQVDPGTAYVTLSAAIDGIEVAAATVVVDNMSMDTSFVADIDQKTRNDIMDRVISGAYELTLVHDLELDGTLAISIAGSEADLFSGNPLAEVQVNDLVFTSDVAQAGNLTAQELELIAGFPAIYIGYSGTASGTRPSNQSRFTPDQTLQAQLKITAQIRIGEVAGG